MIPTNGLRLSHYGHGGVKTEVNGVELQEVVDIDLRCPVGGLVELTVRQYVHPELDVTLNGIVCPEIIALPGFDIDVEHLSPTQTRYRGVQRGHECINCHRELSEKRAEVELARTAFSFGPGTPPGAPRKEVGPFCGSCYDLVYQHMKVSR